MGAAVGDFDDDGWPDLFVTAVGGNRLFRNLGGKRFEDVTDRGRGCAAPAALAGRRRPTTFLRSDRADPVPVVGDVPRLRRRRPARPVRLPLPHVVAGRTTSGCEAVLPRRRPGVRPADAVPRRRTACCTATSAAGGSRTCRRRPACRSASDRTRRRAAAGRQGARRRRLRPGRATAGRTWSSPTTRSGTSSSTTSRPRRRPAVRGDRADRRTSPTPTAGRAAAWGSTRPRSGRASRRSSIANFTNEPNTLLRLQPTEPAAVPRHGAGRRAGRAEPRADEVRGRVLRLRPRRPAGPASPANGHLEPDIAAAQPRPDVRAAGAAVLEHRRPGPAVRAGDAAQAGPGPVPPDGRPRVRLPGLRRRRRPRPGR